MHRFSLLLKGNAVAPGRGKGKRRGHRHAVTQCADNVTDSSDASETCGYIASS